MLPNEKKESAVAFLKAAVASYASLRVVAQRVMTDIGACYKSFAFCDACRDLGMRHIRTKPYTPKTNGKAEQFIQTALREWAYAQAYPNSIRRAAELPIWLHRYNWHRPHSGNKIKTANQPPPPRRGQPVEPPQLERPGLAHRRSPADPEGPVPTSGRRSCLSNARSVVYGVRRKAAGAIQDCTRVPGGGLLPVSNLSITDAAGRGVVIVIGSACR